MTPSSRSTRQSGMSVIAVTGQPGAGKTTLVDMIAPWFPGWQRLSIDTTRAAGYDWPQLAKQVRDLRCNAIVESVVMPIGYRYALKRHRTTYVDVTCDEVVRQERMVERYGRPVPPRDYPRNGIAVDTTHGLVEDEVRRLVCDAVRGQWRSEPW